MGGYFLYSPKFIFVISFSAMVDPHVKIVGRVKGGRERRKIEGCERYTWVYIRPL